MKGDQPSANDEESGPLPLRDATNPVKNGRLPRSAPKAPLALDLMREFEKFSRYKVEKLVLIQQAEIFLALSNGALHVHDLHTCDLKQTLNKSKGLTALDVITFDHALGDHADSISNVKVPISRVAIAVKRKILLFEWTAAESTSDVKEFTVVSGIKSLTWISGQKLVVGLASNYVLLDTETGAATEIVGPGSIGGAPGQDGGRLGGAGITGMGYLGMTAPMPLATKVGREEVLLAKDINTHFIDLNGNPIGRRQIPWANAPDAIGFSQPFLLSLQKAKGSLEVRNPQTLSLLQILDLPSVSQIEIIGPESKWMYDDGSILALSERAIWRVEPLNGDSQIDDLVQQNRFDEAISLLEQFDQNRLNNKAAKLRDVKILKAQILFDQEKFRDSIDLFTDASAPPDRVISLFPPFIAGSLHVEETVTDQSWNADFKANGHTWKASSIKSQSSLRDESKLDSATKAEGHAKSGVKHDRKPLGNDSAHYCSLGC